MDSREVIEVGRWLFAAVGVACLIACPSRVAAMVEETPDVPWQSLRTPAEPMRASTAEDLLAVHLPHAALETLQTRDGPGEPPRFREGVTSAIVLKVLRSLGHATPRHVLEEIRERKWQGDAAELLLAEADSLGGDLRREMSVRLERADPNRPKESVLGYLQTLPADLLRRNAVAVRDVLHQVDARTSAPLLQLRLEHLMDPASDRWRILSRAAFDWSPVDVALLWGQLEVAAGRPDAALPWLLWGVGMFRVGVEHSVPREDEALVRVADALVAVGLSDWRPADRGLARALDRHFAARSRHTYDAWLRLDEAGQPVQLPPECRDLLQRLAVSEVLRALFRRGARGWETDEDLERWNRACRWPRSIPLPRHRPPPADPSFRRWRAGRWLTLGELARGARDLDRYHRETGDPRVTDIATQSLAKAQFSSRSPQAREVMDLVRSWQSKEDGLCRIADLEELFSPENEELLDFRERELERTRSERSLVDLARLHLRLSRPDRALPYAVLALARHDGRTDLHARALLRLKSALRELGWPWEVAVRGEQILAPAVHAHLKPPESFPPNECAGIVDRIIGRTTLELSPEQDLDLREYASVCSLGGPLHVRAKLRHLRIRRGAAPD